jgi:membrane associated rhomboid family serine protease
VKRLADEVKARLGLPLVLVVAMWLVHVMNLVLGDLQIGPGIRPRDPQALWGILLSPFLHVNFTHLVANTLPFLILGWLVSLRGLRDFVVVTAFVALVGGGAVWLFGRPASEHVGASGVVFGYLGFLLARGLFERSLLAVALSLVAFFLYGGMIWGVMPVSTRVSWEGHLFGIMAGILVGRLMSTPTR